MMSEEKRRRVPDEDIYVLVKGKAVREEEEPVDEIDRFLNEMARREMMEAKLEQIRKLKAKEAAERIKYEQQFAPGQPAPVMGMPSLDVKDMVELLVKLKDLPEDDRRRIMEMLMFRGYHGAYPMFLPMPRSDQPSFKDLAEAVKFLVESARMMSQQTDQAALLSFLKEILSLATSQRQQQQQSIDQDITRQLMATVLEVLTGILKSPQKSELEIATETIPKLREIIAMFAPQTSSSSAEMYKAWLEMKRLDHEMAKFERELQAKLEAEKMRSETIRSIIERFDIPSLVGEFMKSLGSARKQSSLPVIECSKCGQRIPIPPGVAKVVCAMCGAVYDVGGGQGEGGEKSAEQSG